MAYRGFVQTLHCPALSKDMIVQYRIKGGHWAARFRAVRVHSRIEDYETAQIDFATIRLSSRL